MQLSNLSVQYSKFFFNVKIKFLYIKNVFLIKEFKKYLFDVFKLIFGGDNVAFGDIFRKRFNKSGNFNYLDDLVNSGKREVKLTSDIVLDNSEELEYNEGIHIKTDNLIIDGNGFQIDAKHKVRIFTIENKNVTFKNIIFKNALSRPLDDSLESIFKSMEGGALSASESKLSFENCAFSQNVAHRGGAISLHFSECFIENCVFHGNGGGEYAGAILNDEMSSLTVIDSEFRVNDSINQASDIYSCESSLKLIGCEFSTPHRDKTSIESSSLGNLVLKNSTFNQTGIDSSSMTVIKDCKFTDSEVNVSNIGSIYCLKEQQEDIPLTSDDVCYLDGEMDRVRELTQHEFAHEFLKNFTKLENGKLTIQDESHAQMNEFLEIWRKIWPHESNFVMADVIVNASSLDFEDITENYLTQVSRKGATDKDSFDRLHAILEDVLGFVGLQSITFSELDELIRSNKDIQLTSDVLLDRDEIEDFKEGIKIEKDNLTIDGHGHIIDAKNNVPIFKISARNVTIENVIFKNASSHMGGAIRNIGDVTFENCKFLDNVASEIGGAIVNDEKMTICNCLFEGNSSGGVGGAIVATFASDLTITDTKFINNEVSLNIDCPGTILPPQAQGFGGAIYNNGKLNILNVKFSENACDVKGGVMIVLPKSKISIESSLFKNNHAKEDGGVFYTMGEVNINDSEFRDNTADNNAGVFDAAESSKLRISNSNFENNSAKKGNVIVNKGRFELTGTEISDSDIIDES